MTTHYTNSKGEAVEISSMAYTHLCNALAKMNRELDGGEGTARQYEERNALMAERIARDLVFTQKVAHLKAQGFFTVLGVIGPEEVPKWCAYNTDGTAMTRRFGTENAAWWELIEKLENTGND